MQRFLTKIPRYWKAVVGAITPGVVALGTAVVDSSDGGSTVTRTEWVGIVLAMLLTGGAVAAKRNLQPAGEPYDPTVSEAEVTPPPPDPDGLR
jgi:hypothetical protein